MPPAGPRTPNPFSPGMGTAPGMFFGRDDEVQQAVSALGGSSPVSIALTGPSRIGKTSTLERVVDVLAESYPEVLCVVSPPVHVRDPEYPFSALVRTVCAALPQAGEPDPDAGTDNGFRPWLMEIAQGRTVILCIDDLDDCWFPDPETRVRFLNALRATTWRAPIGLLVTTRTPVSELCDPEGASSPSLLWNIFRPIELPLLGAEEAKYLLQAPMGKAGFRIGELEEQLADRVAGPHPFLLQSLGFSLFEAKTRHGDQLSPEQLHRVRGEMVRLATPLFNLYVDYVEQRQAGLASVLTALAKEESVTDNALDYLVRLGMARQSDDGSPLLVSDAFRQHILSMDGTTQQPAGSVFVCHAHADEDFTKQFCHDLKQQGVNVWVDWVNISPGVQFDRAIEAALIAASHVIVVVSPASMDSDYVRNEVEWALAHGKEVIPVVCEPVAHVPPRWHTLQRLDAVSPADYSRSLDVLRDQLPRAPGN